MAQEIVKRMVPYFIPNAGMAMITSDAAYADPKLPTATPLASMEGLTFLVQRR